MDITQITKCEFERAYNLYAPSKLEKFFFKYFSQTTLLRNTWLKWTFVGIMMIPFMIALIGTIANAPDKFIGIFTYIFTGLLMLLAIPWIFTWFIHSCRIKKIQKELGVNKYEYEFLVDKFYNEINITKYMKNKVCE